MLTDAAAGAGERIEAGRRRAPSKRSRTAVSTAMVVEPGWTERFTAPLAIVAGPTRQMWLATLGGAALTIQGAAVVWDRLVAEGTVVEQALRERTRWLQRLGRFTIPTKRRS